MTGTSSITRLGLAFWATAPWLLGFAVPAMDAALAPVARRGAAVVVLMALAGWLVGISADRHRIDVAATDRAAWAAALATCAAAVLVLALPQTPLAPLGLGICGAAGLGMLTR